MASDLDLLEKVSLRITLCDTDEKFEKQIQTLLVPILCKLSSAVPAVKSKTVEVLSHISKILKSRPLVRLPVPGLLELFQDASVADSVKVVARLYFETGFPRLPPAEQAALVPNVIRAMPGRSAADQAGMLLCILPCLEQVVVPLGLGTAPTATAFHLDPAFVPHFLELLKDFILVNNSELHVPAAPPPSGLSRNRLNLFVTADGLMPALPSKDRIVAAKRGVLHFVTDLNIFSDTEILPLLFAAVGDMHHEISQAAETAIKHRVSSLEIETASFAHMLFGLLLGSPVGPGAPSSPDERRSACNIKLRVFIMPYLLRCAPAVAIFPAALQAVFCCLNGEGATARTRVLGILFVHRLFELSPQSAINSFGKVIFTTLLLKLVTAADTPSELVGLCYTAIGKLSRRLPDLVHDNMELLTRLFDSLANADAPVAAIQETLHLVREAYANPGQAVKDSVLALLATQLQKPVPNARLIAIQYAGQLFPRSDASSRLLCLAASCDEREDITQEARTILFRLHRNNSVVATTAETFYPDFQDMLEHVCVKLGGMAALELPLKTLPFPTPVMINILSYLRCCLGAAAGVDEDEETFVARSGLVGQRTAAIAAYLNRACAKSERLGLGSPVLSYYAVVQSCLNPTDSSLLHVEAMHCLYDIIAAVPARLPIRDFQWLLSFATQPVEPLRDAACVVLGAVVSSMADDLRTILYQSVLARLSSTKASSVEQRHGLLGCLGHLAAHCADASEAVAVIVSNLADTSELVVLAACKALGEMSRTRPLPLPDGDGGAVVASSLSVPSPSSAASTLPAAPASPAASTAQNSASVVGSADAEAADPSGQVAMDQSTQSALPGPVPAESTAVSSQEPTAMVVADASTNVSTEPIVSSTPTTSSAAAELPDTSPASRPTKTSVIARLFLLVTKPLPKAGAGAAVADAPAGSSTSASSNAAQNISSKVQEAALMAAGLIGASQCPHPCFAQLKQQLFVCGEKLTSPEMQMSVGLALALVASGSQSTAIFDEFHPPPNPQGSLGSPAQAQAQANAATATETHTPATDSSTASQPSEAVSQPATLSSPPLSQILDEILQQWTKKPLARARQAAGVWLLSLVRHCSGFVELREHLPAIQVTFVDLLSEGDEFTQDIATKGLSAVYDLGDTTLRAQLVSALVGTLVEGRQATAQKYVAGSDDPVFEEGVLGHTKDGGKLTTYKELCSLATQLNQPDLIYKFMHLANHNAAWNSRKGAAFGFAKIAAQAKEQLSTFLPAIVPKLYRYQFDPNRSVQDSMSSIWKLLVPDSSKAVDTYFPAILQEIMNSITNKLWRVRESSALALAEILRGRRWSEVSDTLPQLWRLAFRSLDDVKESVRAAGQAACARLRTLSIEVCDSDKSSSKEAVGVVLNCLTEDGLLSPVADIRLTSLSVMVEVTKHGGASIRPHIVALIITLLEALSALESPKLSYIAQRLSGAEGSSATQEMFEDARLAASRASPIMECIDRCVKQIDDTVLPELVPKLVEMMKKGIGPGTKAGCARVTSLMALHLRSQLGPYSGRLLKALMSAATLKSGPIRRDYFNAIGDVARNAPAEALDQLLDRVRTMALSFDRPDSMEASAGVCKALSQKAPDVVRSCAEGILPLAFVGTFTSEEQTRTAWRETWDENTGGDAGLKLYSKEISDLILHLLQQREWPLKKQGGEALSALCVRGATDVLLGRAKDFHTAIAESLKGRVWDGKSVLVGAFVALSVACKDFYTQQSDCLNEVARIVLRECQRFPLEYRKEILVHLAKFCLAHPRDEDFLAMYAVLQPCVEGTVAAAPDGEKQDEKDKQGNSGRIALKEDIRAAALDVLARAWPKAQEKLGPAAVQVWPGLLLALTNSTTKARRAALGCVKDLLTAIEERTFADSVSAADFALLIDAVLKHLQDKQSAVRRAAVEALLQAQRCGRLSKDDMLLDRVRAGVGALEAAESDVGVGEMLARLAAALLKRPADDS